MLKDGEFDLNGAVTQLLHAYCSGIVLEDLTSACRPQSVAQARAIQHGLIERLGGHGGWKLGKVDAGIELVNGKPATGSDLPWVALRLAVAQEYRKAESDIVSWWRTAQAWLPTRKELVLMLIHGAVPDLMRLNFPANSFLRPYSLGHGVI